MHSTIDTRMLNIAQEAALQGIGTMSLGEATHRCTDPESL